VGPRLGMGRSGLGRVYALEAGLDWLGLARGPRERLLVSLSGIYLALMVPGRSV